VIIHEITVHLLVTEQNKIKKQKTK